LGRESGYSPGLLSSLARLERGNHKLSPDVETFRLHEKSPPKGLFASPLNGLSGFFHSRQVSTGGDLRPIPSIGTGQRYLGARGEARRIETEEHHAPFSGCDF
jgi:hypothetical protein